MRYLSTLSISILAALSIPALLGQPAVTENYVKGRLLVKFRPQTSAAQVQQVLQTHQARTESLIPQIGVHLLQLPTNASEHAFLNAFRNRPEVEFAELDTIHRPAQISTPNDPLYPYQWQLS